LSDTFYVAVDPKGAYYQAYGRREGPEDRLQHYDDPRPRNRLDETEMRLFANPKNWMQQQRRPSEPGITGSRLFEIHFDGETLKVVAEIDQSGKELWRE
jgi:hypothetical protein